MYDWKGVDHSYKQLGHVKRFATKPQLPESSAEMTLPCAHLNLISSIIACGVNSEYRKIPQYYIIPDKEQNHLNRVLQPRGFAIATIE